MKVRDAMTNDVVTVRPDTPLREVASILVERGISGVPVVDDDGNVVGVVSEGDILVKERGPEGRKSVLARLLGARGKDSKPQARTAGEAMTTPAKTIAPWSSLSTAASRMLEEGIKRLPVVDKDGKLVGILSRADLVRSFARPDAEIEREIREDVLRRALWLSRPEAVTVAVRDGRVALGGSVATRTDAELVSAFAAAIPGVVEVESSIRWGDDRDGRP
jgi:CBS domain-containing protein